jgi:hypothetical protein
MSLHSPLVPTWLLGLGLLIAPAAMSGQAPDSGSTAPAASDSQPALPDSGQKTRASHPDSASRADSTRGSSDTVSSKAPGSTAKSGTRAVPSGPADTVLSAACNARTGPTTVARNLLVVVFAPEARVADRAAVAKTVGGILLGSVSSGEPGAYYLRVPSRGEEYRLRVAADKLIQLDMVRQVGSRACPPLPPPDTTRQNPS